MSAEAARDEFGRLRCQVPGCKARIYGITGLQELQKLQRHLFKVHMARKTMEQVLETRAEWERRK